MRISDWSSDVCSSDLQHRPFPSPLRRPLVQKQANDMRLLSRRSVDDSRTARSCDRKFQTTLNLTGRPRSHRTPPPHSEGSAFPSFSTPTGPPPYSNATTQAPPRSAQATPPLLNT